MNRRTFTGSSFATIFAVSFPLVGCDTTTVADFVNLIATYGAQLATYFGATSIASQLTVLAGKIAADIANWQSGSTASDAIEAINDMIDLVNQIPAAGPYVTLVDLLLAALSGLLLLLPASSTANASSRVQRRTVAPFHYAGFDKKSMTYAKSSLESQWKAANLPLAK